MRRGNPAPPVAASSGRKGPPPPDLLGNLVKKVDILVTAVQWRTRFHRARSGKAVVNVQESGCTGRAGNPDQSHRPPVTRFWLPTMRWVARELKPNRGRAERSVDAVPADHMIIEIGHASVAALRRFRA